MILWDNFNLHIYMENSECLKKILYKGRLKYSSNLRETKVRSSILDQPEKDAVPSCLPTAGFMFPNAELCSKSQLYMF